MPAAFFRIPAKYFVGIVLCTFISMGIAFVPNYQKKAYRGAESVDFAKYYQDGVGYPAGLGYVPVKSIADIEKFRSTTFLLEIDVKNLQPLNYFHGIQTDTYCTTAFKRALSNNLDGGIGRYFVATLDSGEKVFLFLDDTTLDMPKSGVIKLPVAKRQKWMPPMQHLKQAKEVASENMEWYIDAAGTWRKGEEATKVELIRGWILIISFVVSMTAWMIFIKKILKL